MIAALALLSGCAAPPPADPPSFFDDFSQPGLAALARDGWTLRDLPGHPGIVGAAWGPGSIALVDDDSNIAAQPGNRLLRLTASTDGSAPGTVQAQLCHQRKYFEGTYAARLRFSDRPARGPDGDVVVQTFYAVAPLRFDLDPEYSEFDWEYLPNGGWQDPRTRLYGVSWQTVRIEPWLSFNQPHQEFRSMDGWHVLVMQIMGGTTHLFIDGELRAVQGGRNYPVVPMSINFSVWFSPGGLLSGALGLRSYEEDVDWVFYAADRVVSPAEVLAHAADLRRRGVAHVDRLPLPEPPLPGRCDF